MRVRLVRVLAVAVIGLSACSRSSGVELSRDWSGVHGFVLADVNGIVTVVGIDTDRGQARNLVAVPDREDDDPVIAPMLSRGVGGRTYLQRPTAAGASTLYQIVDRDGAANRIGTVAPESRLYPLSGGWAEVTPSAGGSIVRVLDDRLTERRRLSLSVQPDAVATDGAASLCVAENTEARATVVAVDLNSSSVSSPVAFREPIGVLACPEGRPLVGVETEANQDGDGKPVAVVRGGKVPTVQISTGRVYNLIVADGRTYLVAVVRNQVWALVIDLAHGKVVRSVPIEGPEVVDVSFFDSGHLVVAGDRSVAVLDPVSGKVESFGLAGTVYPN